MAYSRNVNISIHDRIYEIIKQKSSNTLWNDFMNHNKQILYDFWW